VVGFGVFTLGQAGWVYELSLLNSIVFGALLSTTDPVATLAIFQTLNCPQVNPITSEVSLLYEYRSTNADAYAILQTLHCPQMLYILALGE
jgi:NhaP-type Na+/H+ and K+/H+ antiporter